MLSIIFGPQQAYTTLATFPTLRAHLVTYEAVDLAILKPFA